MSLRLPNMTREIAAKSEAAIERETALKWAGRAVACYRRYITTGDERWQVRAHDYRHEALEHAAIIGDHGRTAAAIQKRLDHAMKKRKGRL